MEDGDPAALKTEYFEVIVSDVRTTNGLSFSVQKLGTEGIPTFDCEEGFGYLIIFSFASRN